MLEISHIVLRALGAIAALFVMTRLLGKKQISQLTFFEYITGITIGDLAGFISTDVEANYVHGLVAIMVWFLIPFLVEWISLKSKTMRELFEGKGTIVVQHGVILEKNLGKERFTADELMEQLRTKSVFNVADVEFAILETTGDVSVLLKPENQPLTPKHLNLSIPPQHEPVLIITDGVILSEGLDESGRSEVWLLQELKKQGLSLSEIFVAQVDSYGKLYIDVYEDPSPNQMTSAIEPADKHQLLLTGIKQCQAELVQLIQKTDDQMQKKRYISHLHQLTTMKKSMETASQV
ncbi:DUF421 domain-containing protein [Paenibacillus sp. N1-5-1-14]|uniref:DUF421 domain-containing protein n=1 Tax=Paenibacillus radicibacter TaxID=2972488 RepID=UPI002158AB9E|nr:DUF421 domain-containing protein [Paenibacillus radicibacter]MCR8645744.1 DUF421 domain-containing protein [Paenibacillus radicibacter]